MTINAKTPGDGLDSLVNVKTDVQISLNEKIKYALYSFKRWLRSIYLSPRKIKWTYQRATRGYADRDAWSGDYFLAKQIAGILTWIVNDGIGVSTSYRAEDDPYSEDIYGMIARRDAEYLKYAAIFSEYAKNGPALNEDWQNTFGGVLDSEIKDALSWFADHFQEFWD